MAKKNKLTNFIRNAYNKKYQIYVFERITQCHTVSKNDQDYVAYKRAKPIKAGGNIIF